MQITLNVLYIQLSICRLLVIKLTVYNNISNQAAEILVYITSYERTVYTVCGCVFDYVYD